MPPSPSVAALLPTGHPAHSSQLRLQPHPALPWLLGPGAEAGGRSRRAKAAAGSKGAEQTVWALAGQQPLAQPHSKQAGALWP